MKPISQILKSKIGLSFELQDGWKDRGYSAIANKVVHNKKISIASKGLYWYLYTMCFQKDRCYSSYEFLAKELKLNRKTIYKYLKELRDANFVKSIRRGQGKPNVYILKY
jgi:predicted AAA+ superfamily ATPase